jgi:hypothetical protein
MLKLKKVEKNEKSQRVPLRQKWKKLKIKNINA